MAGPYFWVGGTGNWSDSTNHWSTSSGGAPNAANIPTATDTVNFDSASSAAGYTCTVDATATCLNLVVGNPASGVVTLAGSAALDVYGNVSFPTGATLSYSGILTLRATSGTKTFTSNGCAFNGSITLNGSGGTFQWADAFTMSGAAKSFNITGGTPDFTTNSVLLTANGKGVFAFTGTAAVNFYSVTRANTSGYANSLSLSSNLTCTSTFSVTNSHTGRTLVSSSSDIVSRTITAATVGTMSNVDFRFITGAGAGSWNLSANTTVGDAGGNSGITFCASADNYWVGNGGEWDDVANHWANADGGTAGTGRIPCAHDRTFFTSNSFSSGSQSVTTANCTHFGGDMSWNGVLNSPTLNNTVAARSLYGSFTGGSMTISPSNSIVLRPTSSTKVFNQDGATLSGALSISTASTYKITLQSALTLPSTVALTLTIGMIDFAGYTVTVGNMNLSGTSTRSLLNPALVILTGSGTSTFTIATTTGLTADLSTMTLRLNNNSTSDKRITGPNSTSTFMIGEVHIATAGTGLNAFFSSGYINTLRVDAGRSIVQQATFTWKILNPIMLGTSGSHITYASATASSAVTINTSSITRNIDWVDFTDVTGTPGSTWYVGANSGNIARNSGLIFTAAPASGSSGRGALSMGLKIAV